jgi:PPOX class probable F420-dependent enzyme
VNRASNHDALWDVIAGGREGILATIAPSGVPHLSNVYYVVDVGEPEPLIRLSTITTRIKGRHILRDPRAALHVSGDDFFNFAVAEGAVTVAVPAEPGDAATDELFELHGRLGAAGERPAWDQKMLDEGRMVVRIRVERLYGLIPPKRTARGESR